MILDNKMVDQQNKGLGVHLEMLRFLSEIQLYCIYTLYFKRSVLCWCGKILVVVQG